MVIFDNVNSAAQTTQVVGFVMECHILVITTEQKKTWQGDPKKKKLVVAAEWVIQ